MHTWFYCSHASLPSLSKLINERMMLDIKLMALHLRIQHYCSTSWASYFIFFLISGGEIKSRDCPIIHGDPLLFCGWKVHTIPTELSLIPKFRYFKEIAGWGDIISSIVSNKIRKGLRLFTEKLCREQKQELAILYILTEVRFKKYVYLVSMLGKSTSWNFGKVFLFLSLPLSIRHNPNLKNLWNCNLHAHQPGHPLRLNAISLSGKWKVKVTGEVGKGQP